MVFCWNVGLADQVIFCELMPAPSPGEPAWIEILNLTATPFDMAEWKLEGREMAFRFPPFQNKFPEAAILKPFERLVISGLDPPELAQTLMLVPQVKVLGPWLGTLGSDQDRLILRDKNGTVLSRLYYGSGGIWPERHLGTAHSLEIVDRDRAVNDGRNWKVSHSLGGSPGSVTIPPQGLPVALPPVSVYEKEVLFDYDASWRYEDSGRELGAGWRRDEFDDSHWQEGVGLFGFEEVPLPQPGLQTQLRRGQIAYYFRKTFQVGRVAREARLSIDQILDDGAVYYLNGRRIGRVRMRGGLPAQTTEATGTVTDAIEEEDRVVFGGQWLRQGENVLAVQVHQSSRQSSDLVFGCRLSILHEPERVLRISALSIGPGNDGFLEVQNVSGKALERMRLGLELRGDRVVRSELARPIRLRPEATERISFDEIDLPEGVVREIVLFDPESDRLDDIAPVSERVKGLRQERRGMTDGEWWLKPLEPKALDRSLPRPHEGRVYLSEIYWSTAAQRAWIELAHSGEIPVSADSVRMVVKAPEARLITADHDIGPGEFQVWEVPGQVPSGSVRVDLQNALGETLDVQRFDFERPEQSYTRIREGSDEWYAGLDLTPGEANVGPVEVPVVINEIMPDPPYGSRLGEFVELFNHGSTSQDLSGARFDEGIQFTFPDDFWLEAGAYVVLVGERSWFREAYPHIEPVFDYKGRLSNDGERLRLVSANGNLIDQVDYRVEGDWPKRAAGRGSSLELVHPRAPNRWSSAWRDSNETRKAPFRSFEFRGQYQEVARMGEVSDYRELHFYLVGESHVVLRNIELIDVDSGRNLLSGRLRRSVDAYGDDGGWLIQGNHADSFVEGNRLHLIAHGHGDNRANRAEIDVPGLRPGRDYVLRFEARWVAGSPRLIAHTWDHSFGTSLQLEVPSRLGTPGKANTSLRTSVPPLLEGLAHTPTVPAPGEPVKVSVSIPIGEASHVALRYRRLGQHREDGWMTTEMKRQAVDPGGGSSLTSHQAMIPPGLRQGEVMAFYVCAGNADGLRTYLPRQGERKPALLVCDDRAVPSDLRSLRFVVDPEDLERMEGWGMGSERYPRLSNQYFNATFVSNEETVYYGGELRRSGSPWTRNGGLGRGKWKLPKDREFRGHGKFSFDDDPERWTRHHNRMTRYLLYLLGHPVSENEFVRVIINGDRVMLREDVEPVDADFLDRNFAEGNQGELYRVDDQWWFTDDWQQAHRDATWDFLGSDHSHWYRNAWMKRSREEEDDYSRLIAFFRLISSGEASAAELKRWLDTDQVLRMTAVMGFVGDWDSFTQRRGKNAYFYRRAKDGLFQFLQWDSDLAFQREGRHFYGGSRAFIRWVERPENLVRLMGLLAQLKDYTSPESGRVAAWMSAEAEAHPETVINTELYRRWFRAQDRNVTQFLEWR